MREQLLRLYARFQVLRDSDEGATAVEYGIIVALIAVFIIGAVTALGAAVNRTFTSAAGGMP